MKCKKAYLAAAAMMMVLALLTSGCGSVADKAAEKATEKAIESATDGKAKVDLDNNEVNVTTDEGTFKTGGDYKWSDKMPSDVPELSSGKIISFAENEANDAKNITVLMEGVAKDKIEAYKGEIEKSGWTIESTTTTTDVFMISGVQGERQLVVSFAMNDGETYSGGINYTEPK